MQYTLAVDPGINDPGVALFGDGLLKGVWVPHVDKKGRTRHERMLAAAHAITALAPDQVARLACEQMVYRKSRGVSVPAILELNFISGVVTGAVAWDTLALYRPEDWKGQLSKPRALPRIKGRLSPACLALAEEQLAPLGDLAHNGWDAIGIGLHALGRGLCSRKNA